MTRDRSGVGWVGVSLIGLGIALLLAQWIGWDRIWPLLPLLAGLAFLIGYVAGGYREPGLVFIGTAATLLGVFFFGFTLGFWVWAEMARLWPVFPLIGGLAFAALFLAQRPDRDLGLLGVGLAAVIVGVVGLAIMHGFLAADVVSYWPLLLVLLGLIGLMGTLFRLLRQL